MTHNIMSLFVNVTFEWFKIKLFWFTIVYTLLNERISTQIDVYGSIWNKCTFLESIVNYDKS